MINNLRILFAILLFFGLTVPACASTIPVGVSTGMVLQISAQTATGSDLFAALGVNLNNRLALGLEYACPSNYYKFLARYAFSQNIAVAIFYSTGSYLAWNLDFRMKHNFSETMALVGIIGYDGTYLNGTGQVEYWFMEQLAGNIGIDYTQSVLAFKLGGELVSDRIDIGLDWRLPVNNFSQSQAAFFVAYKF